MDGHMLIITSWTPVGAKNAKKFAPIDFEPLQKYLGYFSSCCLPLALPQSLFWDETAKLC